ncbi:YbhB/YbcL family Raf kinase inhibitor-like protein [Luteimonas granuli]|uniref:YbhB/YbcL family Raf kinase inhibitor-like protein n=1 Tax=Luteimonas granuli TaxID=1176533 RepID=A0A518N428_9GAMM|nr:YbhB/YbcL family Raf kinase inhibitor-like protein [Luteimonas granuli]QDW66658.1 YbhB/YbcL family Raf kinase inhibitor-like protein [Luteimonas granuli]
MRIQSESFGHGRPIPAEFAFGTPDGLGGNRNPQLSWSGAPAGTRSFALLCIDADVPTDPALVANADVDIPVEHPRGDFTHWAMVDIPSQVTSIAAGSCSDGVTPRGKRNPPGPASARQGLNDYTGWFAGDAEMGGDWLGYDGPYPPAHDLRLHRYFFRVFALDVERLDVPARFTGGDVLRAMQGHVLAEAATWGSYSLHPANR